MGSMGRQNTPRIWIPKRRQGLLGREITKYRYAYAGHIYERTGAQILYRATLHSPFRESPRFRQEWRRGKVVHPQWDAGVLFTEMSSGARHRLEGEYAEEDIREAYQTLLGFPLVPTDDEDKPRVGCDWDWPIRDHDDGVDAMNHRFLDKLKKQMDEKSRKKNPSDIKHEIPSPDSVKKKPYDQFDDILHRSTYTQSDHKNRNYSSRWAHEFRAQFQGEWKPPKPEDFGGIPEQILRDEYVYGGTRTGGKYYHADQPKYDHKKFMEDLHRMKDPYRRPPKPNPEHKSTDLVLLFCSSCQEYVHENQVIKVRSGQICGRCIASRHQTQGDRRHG